MDSAIVDAKALYWNTDYRMYLTYVVGVPVLAEAGAGFIISVLIIYHSYGILITDTFPISIPYISATQCLPWC